MIDFVRSLDAEVEPIDTDVVAVNAGRETRPVGRVSLALAAGVIGLVAAGIWQGTRTTETPLRAKPGLAVAPPPAEVAEQVVPEQPEPVPVPSASVSAAPSAAKAPPPPRSAPRAAPAPAPAPKPKPAERPRTDGNEFGI